MSLFLGRLVLEGQALDNQARQIEASVQQQMEVVGITSSIREFCQRVSCGLQEATFEQKRQLVELLIDRIVVTNEEVEVRYVIPTSVRSEQIRFCHLLTDYFMTACVMLGLEGKNNRTKALMRQG